MWKKIKNWCAQYELEDDIEHYCVQIDCVNEEIDDYVADNIVIPKSLLSELNAYQNAVRRIKKLKEKYK